MSLPLGQSTDQYRIAAVCSGNICRSPTSHVVLEALLRKAGLADRVSVESFGLGDWHVGNPMDPRSAATLTRAGYDASRHRAQQLTRARAQHFDLVLAMDEGHRAGLRRLGVPTERIRMQRDFDPAGRGEEVPDPYYGGQRGFDDVLAMIERSSAELVSTLAAHWDGGMAGEAGGGASVSRGPAASSEPTMSSEPTARATT